MSWLDGAPKYKPRGARAKWLPHIIEAYKLAPERKHLGLNVIEVHYYITRHKGVIVKEHAIRHAMKSYREKGYLVTTTRGYLKPSECQL